MWLSEVARLREHDDRPVDGALFQVVEMRPIRGTGISTGGFAITRETLPGPFDVEDPMPAPTPFWRSSFYLPPDSLKVGKRYWVATISRELQGEGLAGVWPEDDKRVTALFEAAIAEDAYAWRPVTQRNGWALGWFNPPAPSPTRARVWRVGRLMWDRPLEGRLVEGVYLTWEVRSGNPKDDLHVPGLPDTGLRLLASQSVQLPAANRFGFPAGSTVVRHHLDLWTGRSVAASARAATARRLECFQAYDRSGRITFERVLESVPSGGHRLGYGEDGWLRQTERWFDSRSHKLLREEIRRRGSTRNDQGGTWSGWQLVSPDSAYAEAPLRRAYLLPGR